MVRQELNLAIESLAVAHHKADRYALRSGFRLWREVWRASRCKQWHTALAMDLRVARYARGLLLDRGEIIRPAPRPRLPEPAEDFPGGTCALAPSPVFEVRKIHRQPALPAPRPVRYAPRRETTGVVFSILYRSGGAHETVHTYDRDTVMVIRRDLYRNNGSWPHPYCHRHRCNHACEGVVLTYKQRQTKVKAETKCASALRKILGG